MLPTILVASFQGIILDSKTLQPVKQAKISDADKSTYSDDNGTFSLETDANVTHIKAYGYRPYELQRDENISTVKLEPISVKALYLTFWGASNNSGTSKNIYKLIQQTDANAIVVDVKNEYGSTSFYTDFEQANSYGAHKDRTNRDIQKFMKRLKNKNIYTIARIVTFKDELQASNNPEYAIKRDDNGTIWRNHDKMAWVDPFDARSHEYAIRMAEEAAKVGFDEINFDYIRFPAKEGLRFSQESTQENRIKAIETFLDKAQKRLQKYGVFISVDTYGNICWADDDNGIGQTVSSLAAHADYLAPMLYPSGFSSGSFYFKRPANHPYAVIYRSVKHIEDRIQSKRVRPWLQYFKDYTPSRRDYKRFEIQEQIRATNDAETNGWMMWSPSSKYYLEDLR
ncbi:MAG: GTP-binding protein [Campylobacterales bacterium]|nr:GTP-binding protein [Campylobacterales bacterium]